MEEEKRGPGRPSNEEIKARARQEAEAEMSGALAEIKAELEELKSRDKQKNAQMANLTVAVQSQGRQLKKTQRRITDQMVRGVAHATGGASHEDLEDGTPWTPHPPDWVTESFLVNGEPTEESEDAVYVWKQAWLDDRPITDIDELKLALEAYNAGTLNLGTYTPMEGPDPEAIAAQITG
jgi:hypothetical protein